MYHLHLQLHDILYPFGLVLPMSPIVFYVQGMLFTMWTFQIHIIWLVKKRKHTYVCIYVCTRMGVYTQTQNINEIEMYVCVCVCVFIQDCASYSKFSKLSSIIKLENAFIFTHTQVLSNTTRTPLGLILTISLGNAWMVLLLYTDSDQHFHSPFIHLEIVALA